MIITELHEVNPVPFKWLEISEYNREGLSVVLKEMKIDEFVLNACMSNTIHPKVEEYSNVNFISLRLAILDHKHYTENITRLSYKIQLLFNEEFIIVLKKHKDISLKYFAPEKINEQFYTSLTTFDLIKSIVTECLNSFEKQALFYIGKIEKLEEYTFLKRHDRTHLKNLYYLKRKIDVSKRTVNYFNEIIEFLETHSKKRSSNRELRDLAKRIQEHYSSLFENISQLINIYFNISSYHTNEIMRILTIFSVFFLPITFIVGVYGMNFKNMPELTWSYGYPICIALMLIITLGIYRWFKIKKWL